MFNVSAASPDRSRGTVRKYRCSQHDGQRHITPKYRAPADQIGDHATDHKPAGTGGGPRRAPRRDRSAPMRPLRGNGGQQPQRRRHRHRRRRACNDRAPASTPTDPAVAPTTAASPNTAVPATMTRRCPNRSPRRAPNIRRPPKNIAYAAAINAPASGDACKSRSIAGSAATTTVTPSTSMNWTRHSDMTPASTLALHRRGRRHKPDHRGRTDTARPLEAHATGVPSWSGFEWVGAAGGLAESSRFARVAGDRPMSDSRWRARETAIVSGDVASLMSPR